MRSRRSVADLVLSTCAAVGTLCLLAAAVGFVFGLRPLVFRSGSMSPTIQTGDLALARRVPATALNVGDVVSVPDGGGYRVTHRVVSINGSGDIRTVRLKGDANAHADATPYSLTQADRVIMHLPKAGYVVGALSSGPGLVGLGAYAALMVNVLVGGDRKRPRPPSGDSGSGSGPRSGARGRRTRGVVSGSLALVVASAGSASATPWIKPVEITSVLTAASVQQPNLVCTGGLLGSVRFDWAPVPSASGYVLTYKLGNNAPVAVQLSSAATSYTLQNAVLSVGLTGSASVVARRAFPQVQWTSAPSTTWNFTIPLVVLGVGVASSCSPA